MAEQDVYNRFLKALALQLRRADGFWLGVVEGDAESVGGAQRVAEMVAERANAPFEVIQARDVAGLVATARELVQPAGHTRPTWVDWSGVGMRVSRRGGDEESEAAFDAVLPAINEFRERLRSCRPGGVVLAVPTWARALAQMTDLFVEGQPSVRLHFALLAPTELEAEEFRRHARQLVQAATEYWLERAPEGIGAAYREQGAGSALEVARPLFASDPSDPAEWSAFQPLLAIGAMLALETTGDEEAASAFKWARRSLETVGQEGWTNALDLMRAASERALSTRALDDWLEEVDHREDGGQGSQRAVSEMFRRRELDVLEQLIDHRWRRRRDHPQSVEWREVVARAHERAGDPWESVRIFEQLIDWHRHRDSPEAVPMPELRAGLARAEAMAVGQGIPRPPSRAEKLLGVNHLDKVNAPAIVAREDESGLSDSLDALIELVRANAPSGDQREALRALLLERGVSAATVEVLFDHLEEGIVLRSGSGRSRLGGAGLLPSGMPWPSNPDGYPLTPLASLDLSDLPRLAPLPPDGKLALYWDSVDPTNADVLATNQVLWIPPDVPSAETAPPEDLSTIFNPIPVAGFRTPIAGDPANVLERVPDEHECERLIDAMDEVSRELYGHQLLGAPREIQQPIFEDLRYQLQHGPNRTKAMFDKSELEGEGWLLLAQIEEEQNIHFADAGSLYFLIPAQDLADRKFDRTAVILQSH